MGNPEMEFLAVLLSRRTRAFAFGRPSSFSQQDNDVSDPGVPSTESFRCFGLNRYLSWLDSQQLRYACLNLLCIGTDFWDFQDQRGIDVGYRISGTADLGQRLAKENSGVGASP